MEIILITTAICNIHFRIRFVIINKEDKTSKMKYVLKNNLPIKYML